MRIENRRRVPIASSAGIRREISELAPAVNPKPVRVYCHEYAKKKRILRHDT